MALDDLSSKFERLTADQKRRIMDVRVVSDLTIGDLLCDGVGITNHLLPENLLDAILCQIDLVKAESKL